MKTCQITLKMNYWPVVLLSILTVSPCAAEECVDLKPSECPGSASLCSNTKYVELMKQQCPKTCGFCTSSNDPVGTTTECADLKPNECPGSVELCSNTKYVALMKQQCPKTCGYCVPSNDAAATTPECVDLKPNECPGIAELCSNTKYIALMKQQCPKTCGYCTPSSDAAGSTTECVDLKPNECPGSAELCSNTKYSALMMQQCAKTCGYCTPSNDPAASTAPPTATGPSTTVEPLTNTESSTTTSPSTTTSSTTTTAGSSRWASCQSPHFTDALRAEAEDLHNSLRSSLAKGQELTLGGGYAPSGKNIYKLVYDCDLENQAQEWADGCQFAHSASSWRDSSENLYMSWGGSVAPAQHLPAAIRSWWSELATYGISNAQNILTTEVSGSGVGHFTAMAWGASTKVGCGFGTDCTNQGSNAALVVCHYRIMGNYINNVIYQLGSPCTADAECTTYANSKCSTSEGLCYV